MQLRERECISPYPMKLLAQIQDAQYNVLLARRGVRILPKLQNPVSSPSWTWSIHHANLHLFSMPQSLNARLPSPALTHLLLAWIWCTETSIHLCTGLPNSGVIADVPYGTFVMLLDEHKGCKLKGCKLITY